MSIRSYKWSVAGLLCVAIFLSWRCCVLFGQVVAADFVDKECKNTEDLCSDYALMSNRDPSFLAIRLKFLIGYYEGRSNTLAGSHLEQIVRRDYDQALTKVLDTLRRETTNDLGNDPHAWIQKYEK
jgi:hypothetical protein